MPRSTRRLLDKLREVEALKEERRYRPPGILTKLGKGVVAFFRDCVRIAEHMLSVGPFIRVQKILFAIGAASIGPGAVYGVVHAIITGEVSRAGAVVLTAHEDPFGFYALMLIGGLGAALGTVFAVALLVVLLKGRALGSRN